MLGDRRGIDFHARALAEGSELSGHPGELIGRYGGPAHLLLLLHAADGASARAMDALQGLGLMGDPRGVPILLEALAGRSLQVTEIASGALQILTGHNEDVEEPGYRHRWLAWWETNRANFRDGVRYREGRRFDGAMLIERMEHHDAWTRRTAYDELCITTGSRLPFDAEGPWRVQQAHLRGWRTWWAEHRHRFEAGQWFLDGKPNA
jgi:HEAT repeat protein